MQRLHFHGFYGESGLTDAVAQAQALVLKQAADKFLRRTVDVKTDDE